MRCQQCGNEIDFKRVCPYCGKEQHEIDPFHSLGDLLNDAESSELNSKAGEDTPAFDEPIYGDMPATGGFMTMDSLTSEEEQTEPIYGDAPAVGGFMDMDALTYDEEGEAVYGDAPATGGFKAMDSLSSEEKTEPGYGDEPGKGGFRGMGPLIPGYENSDKAFVWKRWMTIAACCTATICLFLWAMGSGISPKVVEGNVKTAESSLSTVLDAPIIEVSTEGIDTPKFLISLEERNGYDMLSFDRTSQGATATLRVYAPNVYSVAKKIDANNTFKSEDDLINALDSALRTAPVVETQVSLEYELTDEGYMPVLTTEFLDAYYGGIYQLRDEMIATSAAKAEGR